MNVRFRVLPRQAVAGQERSFDRAVRRMFERRLLFRFVGCLPSAADMSARHRRMRAGVVQTPREETAECSRAA